MAKLKLAPWFIVLVLIAGTLGPGVAAAGGPAEQEISIVAVSPPYGSRDVDRLETLVVRFDREVRWSDTHLAIEPDTAIEVEQTAPNEIGISPRDGWLPGTSYDVRILAGLTASDGAVLQQDFVFSFRTRAGTQLLAFEPQGEAVPTDALVRVEFAQAPSDPAAIAASLRVWRMADAAPVAVDGGVTWETPTTIVWRPATPLVAGADYIVAIGGPGTSAPRHEWGFRTAEQPVSVQVLVGKTRPAPVFALAQGGTGTFTYRWSTGESGPLIHVDVPVGESRTVTVVVESGRQSATASATIQGLPPEPPPGYSVTGKPKVVLTFDDSGAMDDVLDILAQYGAKAVFFPIASWAQTVPQTIDRAVAEGHLVCNHTYSHAMLTTLPDDAVREEIRNGDLTGCPLLRPPGGDHDARVDAIAAELGYRIYMWTTDTRDWERRYAGGAEEILQIALGGAQPGAIILLHMHVENTLQALPAIIFELQRQGYAVTWW